MGAPAPAFYMHVQLTAPRLASIRRLRAYPRISQSTVLRQSALSPPVQASVCIRDLHVAPNIFPIPFVSGGVVYPIMLQHLFGSLDFGWAVRISGLISMMCCIAATLTITSVTSAKAKVDLCPITIKTYTDSRYLFLVIGSSLVALGRCYLFSRHT